MFLTQERLKLRPSTCVPYWPSWSFAIWCRISVTGLEYHSGTTSMYMYIALFVCLTLLASFFLPSHLSFKNMYQKFTPTQSSPSAKGRMKHIQINCSSLVNNLASVMMFVLFFYVYVHVYMVMYRCMYIPYSRARLVEIIHVYSCIAHYSGLFKAVVQEDHVGYSYNDTWRHFMIRMQS